MDREAKINAFLYEFVRLYQNNPNLGIYSETFYAALCAYGTRIPFFGQVGIDFDIQNTFFEYWQKEFASNRNIIVYRTSAQRHFLQFQNGDERNYNHYKLYLNFPKPKMYYAVSKIFHYIANENIEHMSKVANTIRSDSVVLRINHQKDLIKVINFINNDPELRMSALPTNPFLPTEGVIGYGYDKMLSYNETLSMLLEQYFEEKRSSNSLAIVSTKDFQKYTYYIAYNMDKNPELLKSLMENPKVLKTFGRLQGTSSEEEVLTNYKSVIELISLSLSNNLNINDYLKLIDKYKSTAYELTEEKAFKALINGREKEERPEELLKEYTIYAILKYGINNVCNILISYLNGSSRAITRECNFRARFMMSLKATELLAITGGNIKGYVYKTFEAKGKQVFNEICAATSSKYGVFQLTTALKEGMLGNYSYFTNEGKRNLRKQLKLFTPQEVFNYYAREELDKLKLQTSIKR